MTGNISSSGVVGSAAAALALLMGTPAAGQGTGGAPVRLMDRREWQDAAVIARNKLPARASFFPFRSRDAALAGDPTRASNYLSLNGEWRFDWVAKPADAPTGFWRDDADLSGWKTIPVPSDWVRHGYGRYQYADEEYNFPMDVPRPPLAENPVSTYVRDFQLPASWAGQRIIVQFGSVRSAFYLWVNGREIGYSEDSRLPAEFDLTDVVRPGRNRIAIQVVQWPDAAYLEDQDMWRMGGVERDVVLYAEPAEARLEDVEVRASLGEDDRTGTLAVLLRTSAARARFTLLDSQGRTVATLDGRPRAGELRFDRKLPGIAPWTAETPALYKGMVELFDGKGRVVEATTVPVGFRRVEIRDGQLMVNGRPITVKGVNRQEFDPDNLHVITRESMERDVALMKQYNVNALRLSHYPNDPYLYELADRYGLYLVDEANVESHGAMNAKDNLADRPEFHEAHLDRMRRMVERDKNHPSVILWSLGNEAGSGKAFQDMYAWARRRDPSRPVQYEAAGNVDYTDVYVPMYAKPWDISKYLASSPTKPIILCEYEHMMGNSGGTMKDYRALMYTHPQFQGGFIWDWVDQTLRVRRADGTEYFGYPGDYQRDDIEYSFADGMFSSTRVPHPQAEDVKKAYEPVTISAADAEGGRFDLTNRQDFRDTSHLRFDWRLEENGRMVAEGPVTVPAIAPRATGRVAIALPALARRPGAEYHLTITTRTTVAEGPVPAGHLMSSEQVRIGAGRAVDLPPAIGSVSVSRTGSALLVQAGATRVRFDRSTGQLSGLALDGRELMAAGLRPDFWRGMTDNDLGAKLDAKLAIWRDMGAEARLTTFEQKSEGADAVVSTRHALGRGAAQLDTRYRIRPDGTVRVSFHLEPLRTGLPPIPRVGMRFSTARSIDRVEWFGRGPQATYDDRHEAAPVGRYLGTIAGQYHAYARPQESGNKVDVRWMALTPSGGGPGLMVVGDPTFSGGALPYTTEDLDQRNGRQKHSADLRERSEAEVHVDLRQMGLGGDDSWRSTAHPEHMIYPRDYRYSFTLVPLAAGTDPQDATGRIRNAAD